MLAHAGVGSARGFGAALHPERVSEGPLGDRHPSLVPELGECLDRLLGLRPEAFDILEVAPRHLEVGAEEQAVSLRSGLIRRFQLVDQRLGNVEPRRRARQADEVGEDVESLRVSGRQEVDCAAREIVCGDDVSSAVCGMRRALEAGCRRGGESVVAAAELLPVAGRLLEVVAGDLVLLDERGVLVQPERELLVEVGARRLRQPVVSGVADQQVPEPERLVVRQRARRSAGSAPCVRARAVSGERPSVTARARAA